MGSSTICANIGPKQRRLRALFGILLGVLSLVVAGYVWWSGQAWWVRAGLFFPLFFTLMCYFEVRWHT